MSYRSALLLLVGVFVLHFSRILFFGEIIFPHDNAIEAGSRESETSPRIFNRKFSDESRAFLPELAVNLRSDCKGWLATWNPHVQLGRPSSNSVLSRAFALTNLLSCFTSNPFLLYNALVLLTVGLTALFFLLFLRSLGLHWAACSCATLGLAFTTPLSYWLCFIMFVSAICWPVCLLWLITEFTRKPSWPIALGLTFATYCLLLTSYPQVTVLSAYIIGIYTLIRILQIPGVWKERAWLALGLAACAGAGLLAALPVYLDLFFTARESARLSEISDSFFVAILPPCRNLREIASFLVTVFDWSWLGNAIDPNYPAHFNGISFTPFYCSLIWLSFLVKNRRTTWLWQLFLIACLAGTIFPGISPVCSSSSRFRAISHPLGRRGNHSRLCFERFHSDAILRCELRLTIRSAIWLLIPVTAESVVALFVWRPLSIDVAAVLLTFLFVIALVCCWHWRSIPGSLAIAVVAVLLYGRTLILSRPLSNIHITSKLIDAVKTHTANGERFAIADATLTALPPNEEALLGLCSVNSYDSLSSRRYQELIKHWSATGSLVYGRYFEYLDIRRAIGDPDFPLSGVNIVLSNRPFATDRLKLVSETDGTKLYQTVAPPITLSQITQFQLAPGGTAIIRTASYQSALPSHRLEVLNDFQKIAVTSSPQKTILFLSQQYHRAWQAASGRQFLPTVVVNRFYQGVMVPPNTKQIELTFRPFVRWSWLPQLFFAIGALLLLLRAMWHGKPRIAKFWRSTNLNMR